MRQSCLPFTLCCLLFIVMGALIVPRAFTALLAPAHAQTADLPNPVPAMKPASPAVRHAVTTAISAQLDAFRAGDYAKAIKYQSAGLRQSFPSTIAFQTMMENTYPEFAHSKRAQFGAVQSDTANKQAFVPATITGANGTVVKAAYLMVREGALWRVAGVLGGGHRPLPSTPDAASA